MKVLLLILNLAALCSLIACKKDDSGPDNGVGDNDFIEFKLNDTLRQIVLNNSLASSSMVLATSPSPYLFLDFVNGQNGFKNALVFQYSGTPITKKRYNYTALAAQEFPVFTFFPNAQPTNYYDTRPQSVREFIEITRLDSVLGGKIEGIFSFDSLRYQTPSNVLISKGNRITEGKFQITRK